MKMVITDNQAINLKLSYISFLISVFTALKWFTDDLKLLFMSNCFKAKFTLRKKRKERRRERSAVFLSVLDESPRSQLYVCILCALAFAFVVCDSLYIFPQAS